MRVAWPWVAVLLLLVYNLASLSVTIPVGADPVAFNEAASPSLLANTGWPTIGGGYKHQGRSAAAGPEQPATKWLQPITGAGYTRTDNTYLRSTYIGAGPSPHLYVGGGMPGVYRVNAATGDPTTQHLFQVTLPRPEGCGAGETWVEDVTMGADNTLYFVNEGGCAWAVDGATLAMKWQRRLGFLHGPPALYPHPTLGTIVFVMSPDYYVYGLDAETGRVHLRYQYTNGSGNKESVREKGFVWDSAGTLYFGVLGKIFMVDPINNLRPPGPTDPIAGDVARDPDLRHMQNKWPEKPPLTIWGISAGPVISTDNTKLYFSGDGSFIEVDLSRHKVFAYNLGSSDFDRSSSPKTGKERWPALSEDGATVYFSASSGLLYAMEHQLATATTPERLWPRCAYRGDAPARLFEGFKSDPLVDDNGIIYVYAADASIYAVYPDCTLKWKSGAPEYNATSGIRDSFYMGTNLAMDTNGTLYVATTGKNASNQLVSAVWAVHQGSGGGPQPPAAPSNLQAAPATPNRIDLGWDDNSTNETNFIVERRPQNDDPNAAVSTTLAPNAESFSDTTVSAGTTYKYRVRATNGSGASAPAGPVTVTTPVQDTQAPPPITTLAVTTTTTASATLVWTAVADAGPSATAAYDLRYRTSPITSANFDSSSQASSEPAPKPAGQAETFTVGDLASNTTYWFALKVRRDAASNWSALSNVVSDTTQAGSGQLTRIPTSELQITDGPPEASNGTTALVVDGLTYTSWSSNWSTPSTIWLQITLGSSPVVIKRVVWHSPDNTWNDDYELQYQKADGTWERVPGTLPFDTPNKPSPSTEQVDQTVETRALRLLFSNAPPPNSKVKLGSIAEIEVYR